MVQALANRMADYVARNDETANQEVLAYGYGLILMGIVSYTTVLASAFMFGVVREMLIAMAVYLLMRLTVGGCHANRRAVCYVTYAGTLYLSIFLSTFLSFTLYAIVLLYLANVALLIMYAPGDTVEQPMVKRRLLRKIMGLIIVSCLFAFVILFRDMSTERNILLLVATSTSIFLHPYVYKAYRCERSSNN